MCNALIKYLVFGEYQNKSTCPLLSLLSIGPIKTGRESGRCSLVLFIFRSSSPFDEFFWVHLKISITEFKGDATECLLLFPPPMNLKNIRSVVRRSKEDGFLRLFCLKNWFWNFGILSLRAPAHDDASAGSFSAAAAAHSFWVLRLRSEPLSIDDAPQWFELAGEARKSRMGERDWRDATLSIWDAFVSKRGRKLTTDFRLRLSPRYQLSHIIQWS